MNQNGYFQIKSGDVHLHVPGVEPWHKKSEREMLDRSRPGPGAAEQATEQRLWEQVSGKAAAHAPASLSLSQRMAALELELFRQVASGYTGSPQIGDSSHVRVKDYP